MDYYDKEVKRLRLQHRQNRLEASTTVGTPLTKQQAEEAEKIDSLKTQAMLKAEHQCRKLKMGAVSFSEAVAIPLKLIAHWELVLRRKRNVKLSSCLLKRKKKAAGVTTSTRRNALYVARWCVRGRSFSRGHGLTPFQVPITI